MGTVVALHQSVGVSDGDGREQEGDVNRGLRNQHLFIVVSGIDKGFQQVNGADANDRGAQLHFQDRGVDVTEPFGLVTVALQVHAADKGFVATHNDHDEQIRDHDHVNQCQNDQHDDGFVQGRDGHIGFVANAGY